jgi:hypothetical protein
MDSVVLGDWYIWKIEHYPPNNQNKIQGVNM